MILEAIFNGQIYPAETVVPKCRQFRDAGEAIASIMTYFEQKLSKEDYDKLEKLNDHFADSQCYPDTMGRYLHHAVFYRHF